jgi:hypothetical protein
VPVEDISRWRQLADLSFLCQSTARNLGPAAIEASAKIEGEGGFVRDDGRMPIERLTEFSQLSKGEQKRGAGRPHGSSNTLSDKLHAIATL